MGLPVMGGGRRGRKIPVRQGARGGRSGPVCRLPGPMDVLMWRLMGVMSVIALLAALVILYFLLTG
ncbi:hypothetical protein CKO35_16465 [Ectothiorhodospira shaposhnikovii]|nr:hypothetical protein [Ectothiorhodospira shaposhnikovii]